MSAYFVNGVARCCLLTGLRALCVCARVSRPTPGRMTCKPFMLLLKSPLLPPACLQERHETLADAELLSTPLCCIQVATLCTGACTLLPAPHVVATCLQKQAGGCNHAAPVWQQPRCADGDGLLCLPGQARALLHCVLDESMLGSAVRLTLSLHACRSVQIWSCSARQLRWRSCSWTDPLRRLQRRVQSDRRERRRRCTQMCAAACSCAGAHRQCKASEDGTCVQLAPAQERPESWPCRLAPTARRPQPMLHAAMTRSQCEARSCNPFSMLPPACAL